MSNTDVVPFVESTLEVIDFSPPEPLERQFPYLARPGMSDDQVESLLVLASEYMADYQNISPDYLTQTIRGETTQQVLECWGCIVVKKEGLFFVNSKTGEQQQAYSVIFKLKEGDSFKYLGFTSVSAWTFVKRFVLTWPSVRGQLGNWSKPVCFTVQQQKAATGHTFSFKLIRANLS